MIKADYTNSLLFLAMLLISGCGLFENASVKERPVFMTQTTSVVPAVITDTSQPVIGNVTVVLGEEDSQACRAKLAGFASDGVTAQVSWDVEGAPVVDFIGKEALSETETAKAAEDLIALAASIPECGFKKFSFRAPTDDGSYFEGAVFRENYASFKDGKITPAEFNRRLEIKKLATIASLKIKLVEARSNADHGYAMKLVDEWLTKEPDNVTAKMIKANVLLDQKHAAAASELYGTLILLQPKNFSVRFNLAFAKREQGLFSEAIAILKELDADDYEGRFLTSDDLRIHLIDAYLNNNEITAAKAVLEKVKNSSAESVVFLRAAIKRAEKDFVGAKEVLEEHLAKNGESGMARFNLVLTNLDLQDADGARREFQTLSVHHPELASELKFISLLTKAPKKPLEDL